MELNVCSSWIVFAKECKEPKGEETPIANRPDQIGSGAANGERSAGMGTRLDGANSCEKIAWWYW
jgi:hypothetical protein